MKRSSSLNLSYFFVLLVSLRRSRLGPKTNYLTSESQTDKIDINYKLNEHRALRGDNVQLEPLHDRETEFELVLLSERLVVLLQKASSRLSEFGSLIATEWSVAQVGPEWKCNNSPKCACMYYKKPFMVFGSCSLCHAS